MAAPVTLKGSKLLVRVETAPSTFTNMCAIATKGITLSAGSNEYTVPDCLTPDDPGWTNRTVSTLSASASGSGILAMADLIHWRTWFDSADVQTVRISVGAELAGLGQGRYAFPGLLTELTLTGNNGEFVNINFTIVSSGKVDWVDA